MNSYFIHETNFIYIYIYLMLKVALNSITIIPLLFYAQICFIFMSFVVEEINFYVFTPNIAKILLNLVLNTNQSTSGMQNLLDVQFVRMLNFIKGTY
jgi:hypothetical protein